MNSIRYTMTQPKDWLEAAKLEADKRGWTLSQWIGYAMLKQIPRDERHKLSERPAANRPKKNTD